MGKLERKQRRGRKGAGERGQPAAHREHGLEKFLEVELSIIFVRLKSVVKFKCRKLSINEKPKRGRERQQERERDRERTQD
jgi:hypothetical protein